MGNSFSSKAWYKFYRSQKYAYYKWQIARLGADGKPEPNMLNCFGRSIKSAELNASEIGIQQVLDARQKRKATLDAQQLELRRLKSDLDDKLEREKKRLKKTLDSGREQASRLEKDPRFQNFVKGVINDMKKIQRQEDRCRLTQARIDGDDTHIERLNVMKEKAMQEDDEAVDMTELYELLLPSLNDFDTSNIKSAIKAEEVATRVDLAIENRDDQLRQMSADGVGSSSNSQPVDNDFAMVMKMLLDSSRTNDAEASRTSNKLTSKKSIIIDEDDDVTVAASDDDLEFLFSKEDASSKKSSGKGKAKLSAFSIKNSNYASDAY